MPAQHFRIFISSPSDVFAERERVERVINRLNGEFGGSLLEAIRWERSYYTAAATFQDQIPLPSQTDLVILILWKRLGFELPPVYRRADGTTPTGTEYEFEDAMQAAKAKGTPDVLVYRKTAPVLLNAEQIEIEHAQFESLKHFWSRWFQAESGHFTAAYQSFETTDQFESEVEDHIRQWLVRHKVTSAEVRWPIELRGSPFRGLQPFDVEHAEVFFGRGRTIERARERLTDAARRGTPFLLLLGTSGSGKSSLARAGLIPRLTQPGAVPGVDVWRQCSLRPSEGDNALHALARALYRPDALPELAAGDNPGPADFAGLLASAPDAAARAVRIALQRGTASVAAREGFDRTVEARLLLLVDQFEEALASPESREQFARALSALAATGVVWIVVTLRSDLYALFQSSASLMALREAGAQLDVLPPTLAELNEIITGPAAAAGLRFETRSDGTGLDEELAEAANQPNALPLLQLTLDALFEARDRLANLLTFSAYKILGGLTGVVERRAESALAALDADAASALPAVLRALVDVSEEGMLTGRAAPATQIAATPDAKRLVDAFVVARLLVADVHGEETNYRVAHDALLAGWPRAAGLIAADREALRTRGRVDMAARRWIAEGHDADFLLPPGRPLAEAVELAEKRPDSLDAVSLAFITASREADDARRAAAEAQAQRELRVKAEAEQTRADAAVRVARRTRAAAVAVSILLLAAAGAAFYANAQRQEADRNFRAALDGGASLIDVVEQHLRDGGMSREVARTLLGSANQTLGGLVEKGNGASPPLQDTRLRLQDSFANVQLALCDSVGARTRATDAVAIAEAVAKDAPTQARQIALVLALDALGKAARGDGDSQTALAAYRRAEGIAAPHASESDDWTRALRTVRRDLATALLDEGERDTALGLLRDDLAWQQSQERLHPNDPAILALEALDLRGIAFANFGRNESAAAGEAVDQEAAILQRLAALQPANLEWQRGLSINAGQSSALSAAKGDRKAALAKAQTAADLAGTVLTHDPGNAEWQRDLVLANVRLGSAFARSRDLDATLRVLRPTIDKARSLTGEKSSSALCKGDAAQLHQMAGNALLLTGDTAGAIVEYESGLATAKQIVAETPNNADRLRDLVQAEMSVAQAYAFSDKPAAVIEHDRAGIEIAKQLAARDSSNVQWQNALSTLRLDLGDALGKAGDLAGALGAYMDDLTTNEKLAGAQPERLQWQHESVVSQLRIAALQAQANKPDEQWAALQAASSRAERLVALQPGNADWQRDLLNAREAVAAAELVRKEYASALAHYREALSLADELVKNNPSDLPSRAAQAMALTYVGRAYASGGQPGEGKTYLDKGTAAMEALSKPNASAR